jgi:hypothetical protein
MPCTGGCVWPLVWSPVSLRVDRTPRIQGRPSCGKHTRRHAASHVSCRRREMDKTLCCAALSVARTATCMVRQLQRSPQSR